MKSKQVKCQSGLTGSQYRVKDSYSSLDELRSFSEVYGIHKRLGYPSAQDLWKANPLIQSSVNPNDLRVVLDEHNRCEFIRPEVEAVVKKFLKKEITQEQFIKKLYTFDKVLKRLFGTKGNKQIWFRTFKGNTGAMWISEIERDLNTLPNCYQRNCEFLLSSLELGVNELGMEVYFS